MQPYTLPASRSLVFQSGSSTAPFIKNIFWDPKISLQVIDIFYNNHCGNFFGKAFINVNNGWPISNWHVRFVHVLIEVSSNSNVGSCSNGVVLFGNLPDILPCILQDYTLLHMISHDVLSILLRDLLLHTSSTYHLVYMF